MEFIQAIAAFLSGAYGLIKGLMVLGLLGVSIMAVLSVIGLIGSKMKGGTKKYSKKHGFFQLHDSTHFDVSSAIKCRIQGGFLVGDPADDEATPDVLCTTDKPVAVLKFEGDTMATGRKVMARLIDEVIINKEKFGGCVVVVASPGGGVAEYGQLYSEMLRLRNAGVVLTVCVDTYAASGGYLMSLPANRIVAAPFSSVASIGVVSEFLNFHDFLKALGIRPMTITAGERKRTLTPFGEVTPEKEAAYQEHLVAIHDQFKAVVKKHRPNVDVERVCNGDHWTAQKAFDENMGLVDELGTSQEYLLKVNMDSNLVYLTEKSNPFEKGILRMLTASIDHVMARISERAFGRIG